MGEIVENIIRLIEKHNISAYSISKNTGISEAGIGKILNKKVKKPHRTTLETILNYLSKLERSTINPNTINSVVGDNNINASNINSKNSNVKVGSDSDISNCIEEKKELLERLKQSQEQLSESQRQVNKLVDHLVEKDKQISKLIDKIK